MYSKSLQSLDLCVTDIEDGGDYFCFAHLLLLLMWDTAGDFGREKLAMLRCGFSGCCPTLQLWASLLFPMVAPTWIVLLHSCCLQKVLSLAGSF